VKLEAENLAGVCLGCTELPFTNLGAHLAAHTSHSLHGAGPRLSEVHRAARAKLEAY